MLDVPQEQSSNCLAVIRQVSKSGPEPSTYLKAIILYLR